MKLVFELSTQDHASKRPDVRTYLGLFFLTNFIYPGVCCGANYQSAASLTAVELILERLQLFWPAVQLVLTSE